MENSSKALLIVAAVLIAIILIAFGIRVFSSSKDVSTEAEGVGASITHQTGEVTESLGDIFDVQREFTMGEDIYYPIQEQEQGQNNYGDWLINNVEDLVIFAKFINGELNEDEKNEVPMNFQNLSDTSGINVVLMQDLDLNSYNNWTPIGKDGNHTFKGIFDGNNKTISNIKVNVANDRVKEENGEFVKSENGNDIYMYAGLFGAANTIKNLTVNGARISGKNYVGVIAGVISNKIENCNNDNNCVVNGDRYVGRHSWYGY